MKLFLTSLALASVALSSCSSIKRPAGVASATLSVEGGAAAYYASAAGGDGTLSFQGKNYPFSLKAGGGGGSGAQSITVNGEVFNLSKLSDFPGKYTSKRSGITVGKGTFKALLTNDNGVSIFLEGETTGIGSNLGMSVVTIEFE